MSCSSGLDRYAGQRRIIPIAFRGERSLRRACHLRREADLDHRDERTHTFVGDAAFTVGLVPCGSSAACTACNRGSMTAGSTLLRVSTASVEPRHIGVAQWGDRRVADQ
jgi:hypothetical protein